MTVVFQEDKSQFIVEKMLYADPAFMRAVVRKLIVGQTEAMIDMAIDSQEQMPEVRTREGIQAMLGDVKASAMDYAEDIVADFRISLMEALREAHYGAAVTGIKFDLAGDVTDIEVDISVS